MNITDDWYKTRTDGNAGLQQVQAEEAKLGAPPVNPGPKKGPAPATTN
jgi:hypothetical protein